MALCLVHAVAGPATKRHDDIGIRADTGGHSKLTDPVQCRRQRGLGLDAPVIIDLVSEAR